MGAYVDPENGTKEDWLSEHGTPFDCGTLWKDLPTGDLPVCLVDSGSHTAAGIAYSEAEYLEFLRPDGRLKQWFLVDEDSLYSVSPDLKNYLKQARTYSYSKTQKVICDECEWRGHASEVDRVKDPKSDMVWDVCPKCRTAEHLSQVCDEPDCWEHATCGVSFEGVYRRTCGEHLA